MTRPWHHSSLGIKHVSITWTITSDSYSRAHNFKIDIRDLRMGWQYNRSKKRNTPIYFNTNNGTEMKLVPIIMDYCVLQFDALKFFLGVRLHGGFQPNFNFFNVNRQIFQRNRKVHLTNCLETNFHNISGINLRGNFMILLKIWVFTLKKFKLGKDHKCRRTSKKNYKASNWSTQ